MAISDFRIATKTIESKGGTFEVRGISLEDLTALAETYLLDIQKAVADFGARRNMLVERASTPEFILLLLKDFPALAAEIISRAADEPTMAPTVRRFGFGVQLKALEAVFSLTIEEAGGLKNVLAAMVALMETSQLSPPDGVMTRLQTIIGEFVKPSPSSPPMDTPMQPDTRS